MKLSNDDLGEAQSNDEARSFWVRVFLQELAYERQKGNTIQSEPSLLETISDTADEALTQWLARF